MTPLTTALLLASSGDSPPSSVAPPVDTEAPAPGPSLLDVVHESTIFDTSKPESVPEPGWRARQRQTSARERPVVKQETWSSRKQRRAKGDRRTAKQIVTSMKEG